MGGCEAARLETKGLTSPNSTRVYSICWLFSHLPNVHSTTSTRLLLRLKSHYQSPNISSPHCKPPSPPRTKHCNP